MLVLAASLGMSGSTCMPTPTPEPNPQPNPLLAITDKDHVLGDPNAPLTMIEYSDLQCPFCRKFAQETFPTLKRDYIDTGKMKYVYRHFPLAIHNCARVSARAAECAGKQGKFFEFIEVVLADPNSVPPCLSRMQEVGAQVGLADVNAFNACVNVNGGEEDRIMIDEQSGNALGVTGTPAFFFSNGKKVTGAQPLQTFRNAIE